MQNVETNTLANVQVVDSAPHLLTQSEFIATAQAVPLVNHGRKWDVRMGNYNSFSDADTAEAALIDAHHGAVNNALYFNQEDAPEIPNKPSVPTAEVLASYPDLIEQYADVLAYSQAERTIALPAVSKAEFDAVLAALRLLAASMMGGLVRPGDGDIGEILTDSGTHAGLTAEGVDQLCERIQFEP
ncbi:hypothetical protein LCG56_28950 (plasmid) [Pseudomonas cannabina pv. alisalensis]|uniref:Uncharacterized protein n=1 Tax=Pseudomonas syringae pv. maculicola str. ES4326 TaxID=629265 RepID=A0A8T8CA63_PSEYM|nr:MULTISPECIES: hypothetical protein [Pseudomonas syringae group]QHF00422.1 hypothetical protein PMA4326_028295 [Pseudomonas syringae pv. maculicola str. ES4326]UBZ00398.1 hypothetical protein LCG56_28950 [Pseudomonas cannabina pv. alisalensis]